MPPTPEKQHDPTGGLSAIHLLGQVGTCVALPVVAGVLAGRYLDDWLQTRGLALVFCILLGVAVGIASAALVLIKEIPWKH